MPTAFILRHVAVEGPGLIRPILETRGFAIAELDAATDDLTSDALRSADLLVVMGGPIGAYEEAAYPFLTTEIRLLEHRLTSGLPVLGVCLGAQLMARALGAAVYPGPVKEIGWGQVTLTDAGRASCLAPLAAADTRVLHWHGDTFDLPPDAVLLASTAAVENQAFALGPTALGLQFHIETTARALEGWFVGHAVEIAATEGVSVAALRSDTLRYAAALEAVGPACLTRWLDGLPDR